jgi:hypothetical protein
MSRRPLCWQPSNLPAPTETETAEKIESPATRMPGTFSLGERESTRERRAHERGGRLNVSND